MIGASSREGELDIFSEIISFLLGVVSGSFVTWKVTKNSAHASGGSTIVNQSGAVAGRDLIGGDQKK